MRKVQMEFTFKNDNEYFKFMDTLGCAEEGSYIKVPAKCKVINKDVKEWAYDEIKTCPFCGSSNINVYYFDVNSRADPYDPVVRCNVCDTVLKFRDTVGDDRRYRTLDDIIKVWNRRVNE